jgi:hypothetical protein
MPNTATVDPPKQTKKPALVDKSTIEPKGSGYSNPSPPVGWIVQWFSTGKLGTNALPGVVEEEAKHGKITIRVQGRRRRPWYAHSSNLAEKSRETLGADGVWDYIPGGPQPDVNDPPSLVGTIDKPHLCPWVRQEMQRLVRMGYPSDVVALKVNRHFLRSDVTEEMVNDVVGK